MGRNITVNVKDNKNYFNEYYHSHNKECICECGTSYLYYSKSRHLLSKKHQNLLELKKVQTELDYLKKSIE